MAAKPALPAGGNPVQQHRVSDGDPGDPWSHSHDRASPLVPEHGGHRLAQHPVRQREVGVTDTRGDKPHPDPARARIRKNDLG